MGYGYDAMCQSCGTKFSVHEGSGMAAMPFTVIGVETNGGGSSAPAALWAKKPIPRRVNAEEHSEPTHRHDAPTADRPTSSAILRVRR
jgi:hypothetical protein